jgi:hypothetical protein
VWRYSFSGQEFLITSERQQILDLLLSTYDIAVQRNSELISIRDKLKALNEQFEQKVKERTVMFQAEIEERNCRSNRDGLKVVASQRLVYLRLPILCRPL